ncbi:alcohol oxidase, partial [Fistulina hepatica ATCC 64428]
GLTVASRLTEDPAVSVVVLEAGSENANDPAIMLFGQHGSHFGVPSYDWNFKVVRRLFSAHLPWAANSRAVGKGLGGSSAINFGCWVVPPKNDVDNWEKLGNPGWNWDEFNKYLKKLKNVGGSHMARVGTPFNDTPGPIKLSVPPVTFDADLKMRQSFLRSGFPMAPAPVSAFLPHGLYIVPTTMNPDTLQRSYAATEYFYPFAQRPNYQVLLDAQVHRIINDDKEDGQLNATAVEFSIGNDPKTTYQIRVGREAVLSAGVLKSSQILELSGIGRADVLAKIGIDVRLQLDGVGENVQEHNYAGLTFEMADSVLDELPINLVNLRDPAVAVKHKELLGQRKGAHSGNIYTFAYMPLKEVSDSAQDVFSREEQLISQGQYNSGLLKQWQLQLDRKKKGENYDCEFVGIPGFLSYGPNMPEAGKQYYSLLIAANQPLSRGSVHAVSSNPYDPPEVDPRYFSHELDIFTLVESFKRAREVAQTAPFKDIIINGEQNPGIKVQSDEEIAEWVKNYNGTMWHTIGACTMAPREEGGVVDPKLKVYGTKNIRVVDLSVVPLHISSHTVCKSNWAV